MSASRPVAVTFVIELAVDLGSRLDGVSVWPERRTVLGRHRSVIAFIRRPASSTVRLAQAIKGWEDYFDGLNITLDDELEQELPDSMKTVAAVTIVHPTRARSFVCTDDWLTKRFEHAVLMLDQILVTIGFMANLPNAGPLRRTELSTHIPVIVDDTVGSESDGREVLLTELELHSFDDWQAYTVGRPGLIEQAVGHSDFFSGPTAPFRLYIAFTQRALKDCSDGLLEQGVISASLAIEVFAAELLRVFWKQEGEDDATITRKLGAGFQNLLKQHLKPRLTQIGVDPRMIDYWLEDCYALRNRVAHEGFAPTNEAAVTAYQATKGLGAMIGEALRRDPRFGSIGEAMPIRAMTPQELGAIRLSRLVHD
jgi:hypothetical protein